MILNESLFEEYSDNNEQLYREIASQVRKEVVDKYGEDFLYGKCIEASDRIVDLLSKEGVNAAAVEGWVHYDYDDGCTDRDYDEHTWVETQDGYVIDVTATQFNHFMDEDYPDIIISKELPYGYSYDEPDTYEDGDWSYKNLFEKKDIIENLPQYLYHATYPHRWKMIKQAGGLKTHLNRRLRNWSDSRDVICLSEDPDAAESYAETALDELDKDWDIIVLKIDTKYLDKSCLSYDANILYDEEDAEEGFEQTEYEYSKDIPLEAISLTLVEAAKRKKK